MFHLDIIRCGDKNTLNARSTSPSDKYMNSLDILQCGHIKFKEFKSKYSVIRNVNLLYIIQCRYKNMLNARILGHKYAMGSCHGQEKHKKRMKGKKTLGLL